MLLEQTDPALIAPIGVQGIAPVSGMLGIAAVLTTSVLVQLPYFKAVLDGCLLEYKSLTQR